MDNRTIEIFNVQMEKYLKEERNLINAYRALVRNKCYMSYDMCFMPKEEFGVSFNLFQRMNDKEDISFHGTNEKVAYEKR